MIKQHKRLIKSSRGKDKDDQEVGLTFIVAIAADVQDVCMVDGGRAR